MQLVDDALIARGLIKVEPGADLVDALESLATAAGWTDAYISGSGMLELVELATGDTLENVELVTLTGVAKRTEQGCKLTLRASMLSAGQLRVGRIEAAVTGELLLVVDAVTDAVARAAVPERRPPVVAPIPASAPTSASTSAPTPKPTSASGAAPTAAAKPADGPRSATKPLSQSFTTKPVVKSFHRDREVDEEAEMWTEVEPGDFLQHPQLGFCEVVADDDSGGTRIRVPSGRTRVLRLDALHLLAPETDEEGRRVFTVTGPRRRRY